jgi:hypothetical protein
MNDIAGKLREHGKVFDEMAERHLRHHYEDIRAQGLEQAVLANAFHAGGDEIDRLQREMAEARAEAGRLKSCNLELAVKAGRLDAENERLKADLDQMRGFRDGLAKIGAELGQENERLREWQRARLEDDDAQRTARERLRMALKQALRQWSMYADMHEGRPGFDLETEQSAEASEYRRLKVLADASGASEQTRGEG